MDANLIDSAMQQPALLPMPPTGQTGPAWTPQYQRHAFRWLAKHGFDDRDGNATRLAGYMGRYVAGGAARGLLLWGGCGRGKTLALRLFAEWAAATYVTAMDLAAAYLDAQGGETFTERFLAPPPVLVGGEQFTPDLIIDDLGTEAAVVCYGTPVDVARRVIDARDQLWHRTGARLHVATNLNREQIVARYDLRTESRLSGLCEPVQFAGQDRRREGGQ